MPEVRAERTLPISSGRADYRPRSWLDQPLPGSRVCPPPGQHEFAHLRLQPAALPALVGEYDASPRAHTDQRTQVILLEVVTENVAVGSGVSVGDAGERSVKDHVGDGATGEIAGGIHAYEDAAQTLEDELIHRAAAVVANVDDQSLLADLREE